MAIDDQLFNLWRVPPDTLGDPVAAFAACYADPVVINEVPFAVTALVERARQLHVAFSEHEIEVVDRVEAPGKLTVAFKHRAKHTGVWRTPLGDFPPTGRTVDGVGIDVLTIDDDGRISRIWVLADELQRIRQVRD
jgi:hypothetical protein